MLTAALFTTVRRGSNPMSIHGRKDAKVWWERKCAATVETEERFLRKLQLELP